MHLHRRSIRARTFFLVLVPLLSLIGLYIFTTIITAGAANSLARATAVRNSIADPIGFFATDIQAERMLATIYLAAPTQANLGALTAEEQKSDQTLAAFRAAADSAGTQGASAPAVKAALAATFKVADTLPALREGIASRQVSRATAQRTYSGVIEAGYGSIVASILQIPNVALVNQSLAIMQIADAEDDLLQSEALLYGDALARNFPAADHAQFSRLVGLYQGLLAQGTEDLTPAYRASFSQAVSPQTMALLTRSENLVINSPGGSLSLAQLQAYKQAATSVSTGLAITAYTLGGTLARAIHQSSVPIDLRLIIAGGLGLLAILVSIGVSIWIGRDLVRQLAALRQGALELANARLPRVMARLSAGESVDLEAEAPPMATSPDEIGQVQQAFNSVQRSAFEAAIGQAQLRAGVSTVFRNLARRSQSLLHNQLSLLDTLERQATEPAELEALFRIDHLTTRMRRHAEGLIVLAGEQTGRTWTEPVPIADALRGAVAEVVDYARIRVVCTSRAALDGRAVADVIHLVAELAENATTFSPPQSPVRIVGTEVVHGFAVEIEDRGIGMSEEAMDGFNGVFEAPTELNLAESDQLGLYVAARLAQRHDIRITLRASPFGGTSVVLLIPSHLVITEGKDAAAGPNPANGRPANPSTGLTGRHASRSNGSGSRAATSLLVDHVTSNGASSEHSDTEPASADLLSAPLIRSWEIPEWAKNPRPGQPDQPDQPDQQPEQLDLDRTELADFQLPRRTRQASLAPELRDQEPDSDADDPGTADERSPDQIRDTLSAMQRGFERGRDEDPAVDLAPAEPEHALLADSEPETSEPEKSERQAHELDDSEPGLPLQEGRYERLPEDSEPGPVAQEPPPGETGTTDASE